MSAQIIPFRGIKRGLRTPFDGWSEQCFHTTTDFKGGTDVWGWLLRHYGTGTGILQLRQQLGEYASWLLGRVALTPDFVYHNVKRSLTTKYGPKEFPLNVLLYCNDTLQWSPDDFRTSYLRWEYAKTIQEITDEPGSAGGG